MSENSNLPLKSIPLIFDDDGSQDGMTALAYMLANPKFDVQAITIANGIARPQIFDDNLKRMLGRLGDTDIPVGVGRSTPLSGNNEFPDFIRDAADTFWSPFVSLPEEVPQIETKPAVDLIIETIKNSPEPVAILATGPLTNIAEALRQDPSIIDNISIVQIMGGAVFVPGNLPILPDPPFSTNETAEFNIWVDPVAAQEVFDAGQKGLKIQLTPLDATNQVEFDRQDYQEWLETGTPESAIAAELLDFALTVIQSDNDPNPVWDLVAAINLSEPDFSPETPLYIDVDTESDPGENQGQTTAVPGLPANVLVSLDPSFDNIAFDAESVFSYLELPVVSFNADQTVISEGGDAQLITFNLSKPAPAGGLAIKLRIDDPDGEPGDTDNARSLFSNIADSGEAVEDGVFVANITIAEGATEATIGIKALADNKVEGDETYSLTLLENENYIVDSASTTITTTIEDVIGGMAIAIENPGFEIPQLPENQFTQTTLGEFIPGWKIFDPAGLVGENVTDVGAFNPTVNVFPSEAPEGENTGYAYSQAAIGSGIFGLTQTLDTELKANTKYTIKVEVGNTAENNPDDGFNYEGFPGYRVELLAGGKVLAKDDNTISIAEGAFETSTVSFTATETEAFLGQNLGIRLVNLLNGAGEDVEFDNVKLFAETVEPILPTVSLNVEPETVTENNEQYTLTLSLSEPAPNGGLQVVFSETDSDNAFGDISFPPELTNASFLESLSPVGDELARSAITISRGATTASLTWNTIPDGETEGDETTTFKLISKEGYVVDSNSQVDILTIVDTSVAKEISLTPLSDNLYGTNAAETIRGGRGDDNISGNGGMDTLIGGRGDDNIYGGFNADVIRGGRGDDNISGNGGMDTLIGGRGDDNIYGGFNADVIRGGRGDDNISGNGGNDLINSGAGFDTVYLGGGEATVILDKGEGFDTIYNFQLGATKFEVSTLDNLTFGDSASGGQIFQDNDLLAVVASQSANTFTSDRDLIFVA